MDENIGLAPAAGSGIGRLLADALLAREDFIPSLVNALVGALHAQTYIRDGKNVRVIPDCRTQLAAVVATLSHMEGDPIKRIIHQHLGNEQKLDLVAAFRESPALLESAKRVIANAEHSHPSHAQRRAARAEPYEVAAVMTQTGDEIPE